MEQSFIIAILLFAVLPAVGTGLIGDAILDEKSNTKIVVIKVIIGVLLIVSSLFIQIIVVAIK